MNPGIRAVTAVVLGASVLGACASQHSVKRLDRKLGEEVNARMAGDNAATTEIAAVRSEVAAVRNDLGQLRTDLGNMRTEFDTRITASEGEVRFAFPVNFAFNDASLSAEAQPALDRFAQVAQKYYGSSKITVEGFADAAGATRYNLDLSKRRAEAVRSYLVGKGMSEGNVMTVGYGESRQVVQGAERDDPGAEQNRRVVFVIETKGEATTAALAGSAP